MHIDITSFSLKTGRVSLSSMYNYHYYLQLLLGSSCYLWSRDVLDREDLAAERHGDFSELIHRHHLLCTEIQGLDVVRHHNPFFIFFMHKVE